MDNTDVLAAPFYQDGHQQKPVLADNAQAWHPHGDSPQKTQIAGESTNLMIKSPTEVLHTKRPSASSCPKSSLPTQVPSPVKPLLLPETDVDMSSEPQHVYVVNSTLNTLTLPGQSNPSTGSLSLLDQAPSSAKHSQPQMQVIPSSAAWQSSMFEIRSMVKKTISTSRSADEQHQPLLLSGEVPSTQSFLTLLQQPQGEEHNPNHEGELVGGGPDDSFAILARDHLQREHRQQQQQQQQQQRHDHQDSISMSANRQPVDSSSTLLIPIYNAEGSSSKNSFSAFSTIPSNQTHTFQFNVPPSSLHTNSLNARILNLRLSEKALDSNPLSSPRGGVDDLEVGASHVNGAVSNAMSNSSAHMLHQSHHGIGNISSGLPPLLVPSGIQGRTSEVVDSLKSLSLQSYQRLLAPPQSSSLNSSLSSTQLSISFDAGGGQRGSFSIPYDVKSGTHKSHHHDIAQMNESGGLSIVSRSIMNSVQSYPTSIVATAMNNPSYSSVKTQHQGLALVDPSQDVVKPPATSMVSFMVSSAQLFFANNRNNNHSFNVRIASKPPIIGNDIFSPRYHQAEIASMAQASHGDVQPTVAGQNDSRQTPLITGTQGGAGSDGSVVPLLQLPPAEEYPLQDYEQYDLQAQPPLGEYDHRATEGLQDGSYPQNSSMGATVRRRKRGRFVSAQRSTPATTAVPTTATSATRYDYEEPYLDDSLARRASRQKFNDYEQSLQEEDSEVISMNQLPPITPSSLGYLQINPRAGYPSPPTLDGSAGGGGYMPDDQQHKPRLTVLSDADPLYSYYDQQSTTSSREQRASTRNQQKELGHGMREMKTRYTRGSGFSGMSYQRDTLRTDYFSNRSSEHRLSDDPEDSMDPSLGPLGQPVETIRRRSKLPINAILGLRQWFKQSLAMPYPSASEKQEMAEKLNLDFRQVHNWFSNTRKRLYAPFLRRHGIILLPFRSLSDDDTRKVMQVVSNCNEDEYMGPL